MAAGIQCWGDHGLFQIDGSTPMLSLKDKGSGTTGGIFSMSNADYVNFSLGSIPYSPGDLIALQCYGAPIALSGKNLDGSAQVMALGANVGFNWWRYCRHIPSGTNVGMEIYDGSGALIYDTGRPILQVVQEIGGAGDFSLPGGRSYAVLTQRTYSRKDKDVRDNGTGFAWIHVDAYHGFIQSTGSGFHAVNELFAGGFVSVVGRMDQQGIDFNMYTLGGTQDNLFTVIDVTNT